MPAGWLKRRLAALERLSYGASLVTRIGAASVLLATLVVGAFAVLVLAIATLRTATTQVDRSKDVTAATLTLEKLVVDLETGTRGFLITGNEKFLAPWREAQVALPGSIAGLKRLVENRPEQERRTQTLAAAIEAYVRDYSVPLVAIARRSPSAARASVATAEGRRRFEAIRGQFERLLAVEDALSKSREASADRQATRAILVGVAALGGSAILILLFGIDLARGIARPVRRAAEAAGRVASGDLSVRVDEKGPGEIHDLSRSFNSMAESLQQGKRALEAQNERLRESERLRSELVSIFTHEVRTPLSSVLGYASLLVNRELDPDDQKRYLEIIAGEGKRLATLVADLQDVRSLEEGRLELKEEPFDVGSLLRQQTRVFADQSDVHTIELDLPDDALAIKGDADRLAQVVGNLLANAIKYSPQGGVVEVSGKRAGDAVRVSVRDEGIGIAREHQTRIFTKFFRAAARAHGISGVGLGLAVSREIVEAHGGTMGFTSSLGEGSHFWFEIPSESGPR